MTPETPSFEDPSLKEALRALSAGQVASETLRARVKMAMAMATAVPEGGQVAPAGHRFGVRQLLRVAAVILAVVGVGTLAVELYEEHQTNAEIEAQRNAPARTLWQAMADLHEAGVASSSCHAPLTAPMSDAAALAAEATKDLGYPVPVPKFGAAGWKLDAASFASINAFNGARFHFTNGAHSATVISLPAAAWTYPTGQTYQTTAEGHAIAGFLKNGGLTCVVGDRTLPMADVQQLADQIRAQ